MSAGRQRQHVTHAEKQPRPRARRSPAASQQEYVIDNFAAVPMRRNALLSALSGEALAFVSREGVVVELRYDTSLHEPDQRAEFVYFPTQGVLSVSSRLQTGRHVESSMVGREGAVGLVEANGGGALRSRARVLAAGAALRLSVDACAQVVADAPEFRRRVDLYIEFMVIELRQAVICHALHALDARLCRWLLECDDRLDADQSLTVTHELLAVAIGAQRTTITERLGLLQAGGLIRSTPGKVVILDRHLLEQQACECRKFVLSAKSASFQEPAAGAI